MIEASSPPPAIGGTGPVLPGASLSARISEVAAGGEPDAGGAPALALRYASYALAAALAASLVMAAHPLSGALLGWLALANAIVAYGYQTGRATVFGKRSDGSISALPRLLLLPYLALLWVFFWLKTFALRRNEPCWHEAAPGLYVGRKPRRSELPPDCTRVVDLTCEFAAAPGIGRAAAYQCLPILNRHVPRERELRALLQALRSHPGGLYVHCGAGRGRSAMVAAALLVLRGHAPDVASAERTLAALRPGVTLHQAQRALIGRCCAALRCGAAPPAHPASACTP